MENEVANLIAKSALYAGKTQALQVEEATRQQDGELANRVEQIIERSVYQDAARSSWRVWGAFWAYVSAILIIPEVQTAIHGLIGAFVPAIYLPLATAVLAGTWPLISKYRDPRPVLDHTKATNGSTQV